MLRSYVVALLDWCKINVIIADKERPILFKEGEVWWCCIGMNIGEEEFGKGIRFTRPVLIFKKLTGNSFLGLPLTGHAKMGSWYIDMPIHGRLSSVILHQARVFDKKRLQRKLTTIKDIDLNAIREKFRELYCPNN
jgi:mRNA interferase MazF